MAKQIVATSRAAQTACARCTASE